MKIAVLGTGMVGRALAVRLAGLWPGDAILDLGGIEGARAAEMYMVLYFTLASRLGTYDFNITVARAA